MATTYKDLKNIENKQQVFNKIKSDGYKLLQEGKIDSKQYYSKTRNIGIELGLIDAKDYPGRLPKIAEVALEVIGGTAGAIGGGILGIPAGPAGVIGGAGIGAGIGSSAASFGADFLGDLLAPDMPKPSLQERTQDALTTGAIDAAITTAIPVAGKALAPAIKKAFKGGKEAIEEVAKKVPDSQTQIGVLERAFGLTDEAAKKAETLAQEGVELSFGQASTSPFVRGIYNLSSRMPLAGAPGQQQLAKTFEAVDNALNARISPLARIKPLTETERSEMIKEFGLQSFNNWRATYKAVYKKAEQEMKKQGDFLNLNPLRVVALRNMPRSVFEEMPKDVQDLMLDINLYGQDALIGTARRKGADIIKPSMNFDDIQALDFRLKDLSKKYDPAKSQVPNNTAYRTVTALQKELKSQLRNPETSYGRLMSAGDRLFKEYMTVVEGPTGKQFQKTLTRGALRPGVGRAPSQRLEDLYSKTFGDVKSPEAVRDLRKLIGNKRIDELAGNYLDDLFTKNLRGDKKDFNKLYKDLGFDNVKSNNFAATQELLKTYKNTNADDLFKFLDILKEFPEALPDVNTFILRSGILRSAQSLGPTALIGTTGINVGGGFGALAGFGILRILNGFLARPFNKKALEKAGKLGKDKKAEFLRRFLDSLPKLPDVPVSAIAAQPLVPVVEQSMTE